MVEEDDPCVFNTLMMIFEMSLILEIILEVLDNYFHKLSHIDLFENFLLRVVFKERGMGSKGFLLIFLRSLLITIQGTYDIGDKVWKLRTLYQGKMVVDLVNSRNSKYLRIMIKCFDQVNL